MVLEPAAQPHKGLPSPYDGAKAMEDPFVRHRLVEADAAIRGLHARLAANFAEMDALIDAGAFFPPELQAKNKWDAQWIAKEAQKAVDLLFKASGARGIRLESPMQRYFRDINAASNHAFLNPDKGSLNAGLREARRHDRRLHALERNTMSVIGLGYVGLNVSSVEAWKTWAHDFMGAMEGPLSPAGVEPQILGEQLKSAQRRLRDREEIGARAGNPASG